ncbi:hypothetical protein [Arthrobacter sp. ES1]|uniref:hypothetical protein n=1 Tax=Arthrobacter sp. ES1 TaxID=1897056 RepID=UPI001CFFEAB5|nr:hypothetical protein [Arthrobacter sp. ES1]MCB5280638.1 hypothetical protein [Arthrobacter sp. ES1]
MSTNTNTINNTDLKNGMRVLIPAGGVISILEDAKPSAVSAGFVLAETSIGPIWFADHLTSKVLPSEEPAAANADALAGAL